MLNCYSKIHSDIISHWFRLTEVGYTKSQLFDLIKQWEKYWDEGYVDGFLKNNISKALLDYTNSYTYINISYRCIFGSRELVDKNWSELKKVEFIEMDELVKDLEKLASKMEELNQVLKTGDNSMYVWKKIEDGILDNIHKANDYQLERLYNFRFKFYSDLNNKENLKNEITKRLRDKKLNDLGL